ncbi:Peroxin-3-domain-containing protein [Pisolithus marmoratus]|nr:Peroxin-3-domain-containing protein [Pisolithus marmoratus]
MFESLQRYVYDRRRGLLDTVMTMGTAYAASAYLRDRLEEVKQNVMKQRVARESLRQRFQSTHDDACFTIMALIPTLATQILEEMDVESLTDELQSLSTSSGARSPAQPPLPHVHDVQSAAETSSISDAQSEAGSMSLSSYSGSGYDVERASGFGSASWVEHMSASGTSQAPRTFFTPPGSQLSDSILSTGSSLSHGTSSDGSSPSPSAKKRKAQLWKEVKNLTLTRALTTLYTTTLLSLLTAAQLSIIARSRYIASVRASERAERAHERIPHFSLTGILTRETIASVVDVEALLPGWLTEDDDLDSEEDINDDISEGTEARYLTLSWWILHVGWKDVAARVRGAVESVFDSVSLRNKLSCSELRALILDARRHVELDGAAGRPHSRFFSCLLPPTPETTAHVLAQGGAPLVPLPSAPQQDCSRAHGKQRAVDPFDPMVIQDGFSAETAIDISSPKPRAVNLPSRTQESSSYTLPKPAPPPLPHSHAFESKPSSSAEVRQESALLSSLRSDPRFISLLDETRAYLSGPDFAYALTCALDRATGVLIDHLHKRVFVDTGNPLNPAEENTNEVQDKGGQADAEGTKTTDANEEPKIRLVGLLPGLARWSQLALNATPNELVDNIMAVREVSALEAIVISDYQDRYPPIS